MSFSLPEIAYRNAKPGFFVSFEGGEGVGKSTQIKLLAEKLTELGKEVVTTREPGGTPAAEAVRKVLLGNEFTNLSPRSEALLFAGSRADVVANVVDPALSRGAVVLADRYLDSSVAYQGVARGLGAVEVKSLSLWATRGLIPDITIVLDLDPTLGLSRAGKPDRLESEEISFHHKVRNAFLELAKLEPARFLVIDATQNVNSISQQIISEVIKRRQA